MTMFGFSQTPLRLRHALQLACLAAAWAWASPASGQNVIRGYAAPLTSYYGGYYVPATTTYRPVTAAAYPATTAYYAGSGYAGASYAVQPVRYVQAAPLPGGGSYTVSYGALPAYGAAAGNPGQPVVAARPVYAYRPAYPTAPVVYYRPMSGVTAYQPVVVYQPAAAAPQNCYYGAAPQCGNSCQTSCAPQNCGFFARLFPRLFGGGSSCNTTCYSSGCAPAACVPAGCGAAPYYPAAVAPPVIPTVPAPAAPGAIRGLPGTTVIPGGTIPSAPAPVRPAAPGVTVPAPPLRLPADTQPNLNAPSGAFNPGPSGALGPGTAPFGANPPAAPFNPNPPPAAPPVNPGFNPNPGGFNPNLYPPQVDPYQNSSGGGSRSIFGSGYSPRSTTAKPASPIAEPGLQPPAAVKPFADPAGPQRDPNRAPQLLDPRDRTAGRYGRFAVAPAVWPTQASTALVVATEAPRTGAVVSAAEGRVPATEGRGLSSDIPSWFSNAPPAPVVAPQPVLDDSGWQAAR